MFLRKSKICSNLIKSINQSVSVINYNTRQQSLFIRDFSLSNTNFARNFIDRENQYAHSILATNSSYNICREIENISTVSELNFSNICDEKNWINKSDLELVESFKNLACYTNNTNICITDIRFDKLIDVITEKCDNFTDEQILDILKHLSLFPETLSINERNFVEIWSALDDVCVDRLKIWDFNQMLLVADHWYKLRLAKTCKYTWQMQRKIERKLKKISPHQLVQTMFYVNLCRKPLIDMFSFEINLANSIHSLNIDEIAVMSMGFFKTQTPIRNHALITEIYKRTILEIKTIRDISLVNILKILRYSSGPKQVEHLKELLTVVIPKIPSLSLLSCLHIALAGTDIQYCHNDSLEEIIERFINEIKTSRIKDMERISLVLGLYNFKSKNGREIVLKNAILEELNNKVEEIAKYPKCLPACLHFLTLSGSYSEEFISFVLDRKFISAAYGQNFLQAREIFSLDSYTRINLKDSYNGNQLNNELRKKLSKLFQYKIPNWNAKQRPSATDRILLEVKDISEDIYRNTEYVYFLPHFERPDIMLIFDKITNVTVNLNDFQFEQNGEILTREHILKEKTNNDNLQIVSIVIGGWNNFVRIENRPTGLLGLKLDQLEILGHLSILIPWFEWNVLSHNPERIEYLKRKMNFQLNRKTSDKD